MKEVLTLAAMLESSNLPEILSGVYIKYTGTVGCKSKNLSLTEILKYRQLKNLPKYSNKVFVCSYFPALAKHWTLEVCILLDKLQRTL